MTPEIIALILGAIVTIITTITAMVLIERDLYTPKWHDLPPSHRK